MDGNEVLEQGLSADEILKREGSFSWMQEREDKTFFHQVY